MNRHLDEATVITTGWSSELVQVETCGKPTRVQGGARSCAWRNEKWVEEERPLPPSSGPQRVKEFRN